MTTIETHHSVADAPGARGAGEATAPTGVTSLFAAIGDWVTTTDHKKIGRLFAGSGLVLLAGSAIVALLLGLERADESSELVDPDALVQLIQAYRFGLILGGLLPITLGLAIAVAPIQVGARQIAFPRVALTGFYMWVGGMALLFAALGNNGGIGGGYAQAVDQFLVAVGLTLAGLAFSAMSLVTTVLTARAPGMTMRRVPLFAWSALIGGLSLLLVTPVAFATVIYLFVDHRYGVSGNFGSSDGIGAWLGWLVAVPAAIAFAVPAVGVGAEIVPVSFRARQQVRGVAFAGLALVGTAALAAITRQTAIAVSLDSDQTFAEFVEDAVPFLLFAGLPLLGIVIVMGLGALTAQSGMAAGGRPKLIPAAVFALFGLGLLALGLVANFLYAIVDLELLGTAFEEGAMLLVAYGAVVLALGGLTFWAPKLWGVELPGLHVIPLALLGALGAALAAAGAIVGGLLDQPGGLPVDDAGVAQLFSLDFSGSAEPLAWLGLAGHGLMAVTVLAFGLLILKVRGAGEAVADNPFGAHTIEWATSSPAPTDNFPAVPTVASAEPVFELSNEGTL